MQHTPRYINPQGSVRFRNRTLAARTISHIVCFFSIIGIDVYVFCYCVRVRYLLCVLCALCTAVECIPKSFVIYVKRAVIFPNPTNTHIKKTPKPTTPVEWFRCGKIDHVQTVQQSDRQAVPTMGCLVHKIYAFRVVIG